MDSWHGVTCCSEAQPVYTAEGLCVSTSGALYSFGCGECGRLGHGEERPRWEPKLVRFFLGKNLRVSCAAAGELHSCVLTESGHVYSFGDCSLGQTSHQGDGPLLKPTRVCLGPHPDRSARVSELAVGDHHTLVRTCASDDTLLAFGKNIEGQLGLGHSEWACWKPAQIKWGA